MSQTDEGHTQQSLADCTKELQAAQKQLIESEKMASLGQLAAGIAHEIKNPLNFVNNFSELSLELIQELETEILRIKENPEKADPEYLLEILQDIRANTMKINEHGKRADSIIRGMLLHSRGKAGELQPTDINAILAEYVNLAYHGLRAHDSSFNIKIESSYDPEVGKINAIPQDLSRVFLNLINNACYSTNEKKKQLKDSYFPVLTIITRRMNEVVEIHIKDNGFGMSPEVKEKIFQAFFTTKPAGEGTGLGLSLSHDIIVNQHHGSLRVESDPGEFAEFIISIPVNLK